MRPTDPMLQRLRRHRAPASFAVVAAFLVGVLVAALAAPDGAVVDPGAQVATGGVGTSTGGGRASGGGQGGSARGLGTADGSSGDPSAGAGAGGSAGGGQGSGGDGSSGAVDPAAPGGAGAAGGGGGGATAPGVSADAITIGFGLPDIGAIAALGPGYDQGSPRQHVDAILAQLRAEGRLPVHGRDIEPVFSTYNIISEDAQRATCETFGNDATVFAVIAIHDFGPGNECTAREFGIPTFTTDGQSEAVYARSAPNLFTLQMSADRHLRNTVAWADRAGLLDGARIGVYYGSDPEAAEVVRKSLIAPLEARGHTIVAEVQTANATTGGPEDSVAVQQFRVNRVDVAILVVSPVAKTNFFVQAQNQGYRPTYLENDIGFATTDTATTTYPASYFDGTVAFTGMRFGEWNSGVAEPEPAAWCRKAIAAQSGNEIPTRGREAEYIAANQACDEILVVLHGLEQAGPQLTRDAFIRGVETIRDRTAGIHGNLTFTPERHDGTRSWRQLRWKGACRCWHVDSPSEPLLVD